MVKDLLAFYGTWHFITVLTKIYTGSSLELNGLSPHPYYSFKIQFSGILPSIPAPSKWSFLSGVWRNFTYLLCPPPPCSTCPAHLIHLHVIVLTISFEIYKIWSFSWCTFLQQPPMSCLLGPISFWTPCSENISLYSNLNIWVVVLHPYKTTGNVVYILRSLHLLILEGKTRN